MKVTNEQFIQLVNENKGITREEIAEHFKIQLPYVTVLIKKLETEGLNVENLADKRATDQKVVKRIRQLYNLQCALKRIAEDKDVNMTVAAVKYHLDKMGIEYKRPKHRFQKAA